jgi:MscS family membrane protein
MFREQTARRCSDHPPTVTSPLRPRLFRWRHWLALLLSCLVAVGGSGLTSTLTLALNARAATAERQSNGDPLVLRKVPGHSPQKTVANFLALTGNAEDLIRRAIDQGLAEPGLLFSPAIYDQAERAGADMRRATQAMDLSQIPVSLRPMSGVGTMLMLRSLLLYDLHQHPDLKIPDIQEVQARQLQSWTIPDTPISLHRISGNDKTIRRACSQCSNGDFLFSADTLIQVPNDFETIFEDRQKPDRHFGADLYTMWALLPGGILPPKPFLLLPPSLRRPLLTVHAGQSLLQWLLLIPVTLAGVAAMIWWLWRIRQWQKQHQSNDGPLPHLLETAAIVPLLALVWAWEWYAIDWVNLFGERQEAVLIVSNLSQGILKALMVYLLAETLGQLISVRSTSLLGLFRTAQPERRQGSGQILTIARCFGLLGAIIIAIQTGRDLGLTSVTLLALSSVPALAISLGTQQLIRDIADGFSLLLDGQIKANDRCSIGKDSEIKGTILSLGMRSVRLQKDDGSILTIPNSEVASAVVVNHTSVTDRHCKLTLALEPEQRSDLPQLLEQARAVLRSVPQLKGSKATVRSGAQGMAMVVSGDWEEELTAPECKARQELLLLQLVALMGGGSSAAPPAMTD